VAAGLLIGAAFGALATRGGVCFNAALRRAAFERNATVLRLFAIAVAAQLVVLALLALLGVSLAPVGLYPAAQVAGGLVFGAGMALAGGCMAGILWKTGAGSIATAVAIGGFAAGELLIRGPGAPALDALDRLARGGSPAATLDAALGLPYAPLAAVLGVLGLLALLIRRRDGLVVGLALGGVSAAAWVAADLTGSGYGLGFAGAAANVGGAVDAGDPSRLGWSVFLAVGVLAGAAVVARGPVRRPDRARLIRALAGGFLMGLSATVARGCNIGLGLAGLPTLSLGSALAVACMALAALVVRRVVLEPRPALRGIERPEPAGW
jgi:hypothetical protein